MKNSELSKEELFSKAKDIDNKTRILKEESSTLFERSFVLSKEVESVDSKRKNILIEIEIAEIELRDIFQELIAKTTPNE